MKTIAILIMVAALTACGTVAGFGSDLKDTADWTKDQIKKI